MPKLSRMVSDKRKRIVVGMSGGVDSSAAAALLLEQGFEVIGVTLKLWPQDCVNRAEDKCCGPQAVMDARAVCHRLNIPYYLVDEAEEFQRLVIQYFADEYKAGRTPNPCVMCNEHLKFGNLLRKARALGADYVATGHYARMQRDEASGRYLLLRGRDLRKDQSYFLFSLRQNQLAHIIFPLGEQTKEDSREVARERQLKTATKEESMEICFVPDRDYGRFLRISGLVSPHRGDIVDMEGRKLGEHEGIEFFTIGQRKGLRISHPTPLYVVGLDAVNNRVIVGGAECLEQSELTVERCNWIPFEQPSRTLEVIAKIRYNHPGAAAIVEARENGTATVRFQEPQRAITPGQACVFYQGEVVVGGGWIRG